MLKRAIRSRGSAKRYKIMAAHPSTPQMPFAGQNPAGVSPHLFNYLENYQGKVDGGQIDVTEGGVRLPPRPCKFVMLANWNVNQADTATLAFYAVSGDGLYENSGREVYYGFGGIYIAQLFPTANSGLLPVKNTSQICLRSRPGATIPIWYAWFY